jgi:L-Ala-D/L-Glu epimerase
MASFSTSTDKLCEFSVSPYRIFLQEVWYPLTGSFGVSHGTVTEVSMIQIRVQDGERVGCGEARLYAAYQESFDNAKKLLSDFINSEAGRLDFVAALRHLPAGATRNALDLAFLDLSVQQLQTPLHTNLALPEPRPVRCTDLTISVSTPERMQDELRAYKRNHPHAQTLRVKIKLGGLNRSLTPQQAIETETARLQAVFSELPEGSEALVDVNEGWNVDILRGLVHLFNELDIAVLEQPLPRGCDADLLTIPELEGRNFALIADESFHQPKDLDSLLPLYDGFNVKLDKTGGLSEALRVADQIKAAQKKLMVGCMVGSSLAVAPAFYIAQLADWADLDGPAYLKNDYANGITFKDGMAYPTFETLWGYPR